jgi:hypothetical protein
MKRCGNLLCSEKNPTFYKSRSGQDGLQHTCKACHRKQYESKYPNARHNKKHKEYNVWTLEEERIFRKEFTYLSTQELCKLLNKSRSAIKSKAKEFGLVKLSFESKRILLDQLPESLNKSGAYCLLNESNKEFYIGSSVNILRRIKEHLNEKEWGNFNLYVVKYCNIDEAEEIEHRIINTYIDNPIMLNTVSFKKQPYIKDVEKIKNKLLGNSVLVNECLEYSWCVNKGYPHIEINGVKYAAHRISYFVHTGEWPNTKLVRHTCNNKLCINPDHLILGTNYDNCMDYQRSRPKKPIAEIRNDWLFTQLTIKQLNQKYGFNIQAIIQNRSYYDPNYHPPKKKSGPK